jgi:Ser/Thr protein kinase RdoA (MazF antagonist)
LEGDQRIQGRLQGFVSGTPWCQSDIAETDQLTDLGAKLAALDLALLDFDDLAARRSHRWDLAAASCHRNKIASIEDPEKRNIAEWMFHFYAASALPLLSDLPHSVIHGDANDENVLVKGGRIQIADILVDKPIPDSARQNIDLWAG